MTIPDTELPTDTAITAVDVAPALQPGPTRLDGTDLHFIKFDYTGCQHAYDYCVAVIVEIDCYASDEDECRYGCETCETYTECLDVDCQHDSKAAAHCVDGHEFVGFDDCQARLAIVDNGIPEKTFDPVDVTLPVVWYDGEVEVCFDVFHYIWRYKGRG